MAAVAGMPAPGIWLGATFVLGRDALVTEPYPHVCHFEWFSRDTARRVKLRRLDCAACVQQFQQRAEPTGDLPEVPAEVLELEARRLGEHTD
jgi:hypothetical protein